MDDFKVGDRVALNRYSSTPGRVAVVVEADSAAVVEVVFDDDQSRAMVHVALLIGAVE